MLPRERDDEIKRLRRKARNIQIEAGYAPASIATQMRALAARYEAEANELAEASVTEPREPAFA
jgi:hypothetical protein